MEQKLVRQGVRAWPGGGERRAVFRGQIKAGGDKPRPYINMLQ
jgi:hypothetical protein